MRADFEEVRNNVPHRGVAGGEGEEIVREFLNERLPGRFRATNGFIIDGNDNVSGHTDVIVYDAFNCPVYRTSNSGMIIPNDNVVSVFEVKFNLTTTRLDEAFKKIHESKNLAKITPREIGGYNFTNSVIFAFECSLDHETVFKRWHKNLTLENPLHNSCNMIVILDRGIFLTTLNLPGRDSSVFLAKGIPDFPVGTDYGISYMEYGENTLDAMMRCFIPYLSIFHNHVHHPGFNFAELGEVPTYWIGKQIGEKDISYNEPSS